MPLLEVFSSMELVASLASQGLSAAIFLAVLAPLKLRLHKSLVHKLVYKRCSVQKSAAAIALHNWLILLLKLHSIFHRTLTFQWNFILFVNY